MIGKASIQSRSNPRVVIDARPQGPRGALALESLEGGSVLDHLLEIASAVGPGPSAKAIVFTSSDDHAGFSEAAAGRYVTMIGPVPNNAFILKADRLYDAKRLKSAWKSGGDSESAVFWRLDRPGGLEGAKDEFTRRRSYQPLGKYWALGPARRLAQALAPTKVHPNAVTLASAALMLAAAGLVAFRARSPIANAAAATAMALALVLDTSDGHLARLQGTASDFGRYLDAWLDELCDMTLHAAIAWGAFLRSGHSGWLLAGMAYAMGKYIFYVGANVIPASKNEGIANGKSGSTLPRNLVRLAGHADIRWHLWIVLAALGRLELALMAYAVYFPFRALLGLLGKAEEARHA